MRVRQALQLWLFSIPTGNLGGDERQPRHARQEFQYDFGHLGGIRETFLVNLGQDSKVV